MSTASLTAKYRPQTFTDVAGQETIKSILSRAAMEDKVAPAYLFSGTRGVGKTTIARIFAKALNCVNAPTTEPCNECEHCKKITQGNHVDVIEIDGASNRGIDDARRLREAIGYAPMEGRYKVFIIDEAHMLTREAFNALLKTLEEPPPRVTFFMATTESHKFPITIVSRCQHYTFKRLREQELEVHLTRILGFENTEFEPSAVKLIARRAAGSVRDSMSLLGQVMALGQEKLEVGAVRSILGLAGQELFFQVMEAIKAQDVVAVSQVIRDILDRGVDIGFFLRELAATWRNLFMLKQAGEGALPLLDLPDDEAKKWLEWVPQFTLSHIHASWQLALEGQRRVLTSLEPAMALELLLLNLAFLPRLLTMEQLSKGTPAPQSGASGTATGSALPSRNAPHNAPSRPAQQPVPPHRAQQSSPPPHRQQQVSPPSQEAPPWDTAQPSASPPANAGSFQKAEDGESELMPSTPKTWDGFLQYCKEQNGEGGKSVSILQSVKAEVSASDVHIHARAAVHYEQLTDGDLQTILQQRVTEYFGEGTTLTVEKPSHEVRTFSQVREELEAHPTVKLVMDELGASLLDYGQVNDSRRKA